MHYMDANLAAGEKAWRQLHKNAASNIEQVLDASPNKAAAVRPLTARHENYPNQTNRTRRTLLEKWGGAHKWCTPIDPFTWPSKSKATSSNLHTAALCVALRTDRKWWMTGRGGEKGSGISVLMARQDDEMMIVIICYSFTLAFIT